MKNKKLWITVVFSVVFVAVILAVLLIGYQKKNPDHTLAPKSGAAQSVGSLEEAVDLA